ncbi:MAG: hypothetical protein ACOYUB_03940 [Patescibacteria group bacterium]
MKLLAASSVDDIFGSVSPPAGMNIGGGGDPIAGLGSLIGWGINIFIIIAGMFLILYLLWGSLDWILSGGEKEKISKAQQKITNALIGMVLVFVVLVVFNVLAGQLLGIVENTGDGFRLKIPTLK